MDMNSGVNPSQGDHERAQINVESELVSYMRTSPPPYSVSDPTRSVVNQQPTVIHQTIIIRGSPFKNKPIYIDCPGCNTTILTDVKYVSTTKTHMIAGFVCGFTIWCMLCCLTAVPYLLPIFKKAEHYCPNCQKLLGQYSKL
ncbi:lipopolysaccharide-induced tumor necrosis factor-alpha factor homolog [Manduca sexta]|uniref:LPS-induced TNF-alpha factor n=1 Tax=Manduca sexta TaxID=7130 RepID=M1SWX5_MANSE|nr:lipopolysaccharide-induced tumor necrosis factor-alpha factor homolog [Manduca sexta]AGG38002.1 LPS-induced TNF-alpha factor [Manduca sexta]KAG6450009.1 hypothetical protein O3G_MSEX006340 [Manduca sexta]KAG6450010.1 hypothetical protein O3G_MSEX006340 [Manduca sexta]